MKAFENCPICHGELKILERPLNWFIKIGNSLFNESNCSSGSSHFNQIYNEDNKELFSLKFYLGRFYLMVVHQDNNQSYLQIEVLDGKSYKNVRYVNLYWEPDFSNLKVLKNRIENIILLK